MSRDNADECARLSEAAPAEDWNRPEEDEAWDYLRPLTAEQRARRQALIDELERLQGPAVDVASEAWRAFREVDASSLPQIIAALRRIEREYAKFARAIHQVRRSWKRELHETGSDAWLRQTEVGAVLTWRLLHQERREGPCPPDGPREWWAWWRTALSPGLDANIREVKAVWKGQREFLRNWGK